MPTEPFALSTVRSAPLEEADYDAICDAMTATARGRWFLEEFARRNRNCDTTEVLAAIARMEAAAADNRAKQATQEVRIELLEMARTIAQARADVAAGRGESPPARAAEPASAPATPDIADAAERLRQIAWTVRACGIELPASEQIEQIAEAILSAGVIHTLGEQQTSRLTEVLHYLEHRVDRMLDSHLAAAGAGGTAPAIIPPRSKTHDIEPLVPPAPDFPLAMVDMTAANTNEAERGPQRPPIVVHSAEEVPVSSAKLTTASPVEPPEPAVEEAQAPAVEPPAAAAPAMVSQPAPPVATQTPAPAPVAPAPVPPAVTSAAATAPQARAAQAAAPMPTAAPMPAASKPAATEAADNAPTRAVSLGDQAVARAAPDAIAAQVDDDLNELTDFAEPETEQRVAAPAPQAAAWSEAALDERGNTPADDPADFLLEAPPDNAVPARAGDKPPTAEMAAAAPVVGAKAPATQMSTVLAAIATELLTKGIPDTPAQPLAASDALAAVMAMSEEERIALFS